MVRPNPTSHTKQKLSQDRNSVGYIDSALKLNGWVNLVLTLSDSIIDFLTVMASAIIAIAIVTNSLFSFNGYFALVLLIGTIPLRFFKRWYEQHERGTEA